MSDLDLQTHTHRRFNPLTEEWVLVSPHRTARPWQGQVEDVTTEQAPRFDAACYMCPGNRRANGAINPEYGSTFVFDNDFPALRPDTPLAVSGDGLRMARGETGLCRVVCFSPRHDLTLARMSRPSIRAVVDVWVSELEAIGRAPAIGYVQIFENRGAMMGASNPHPHGQIWASADMPNEPLKEQLAQQAYLEKNGHDLLGDYLEREQQSEERIVCANEHFVALVPFWAVWPFETLVLPTRHVSGLDDLDDAERDGLSDIIKRFTVRYDNLFHTPFPYSMGFHQRPTDGDSHPAWRLHTHFYPPLLRSATVRKFMVGYEMLGTAQRDTTPEQAAARLRAMSEHHYLGDADDVFAAG
ncbi:MAG: UDP-glucose--hexose-1-phosphate uridylyltransferase [Acidobacteria bacterium]|nr:UDP-glucose--hexose-1-phosphate uridylyltransferase [Acidobacteriota bacterium]